MKYNMIMRDDEGFILVFALLIMAVLTVMCIMATNNSVIELQIAGNEKQAKTVFYDAESAAYEAGQRLNNAKNTDDLNAGSTLLSWLKSGDSDTDFTMAEFAEFTAEEQKRYKSSLQDNSTAKTVSLVAIADGTVDAEDEESSIKVTSSSVYQYKLRGFASAGVNGAAKKMIEIGYRQEY